MYSLFVEGHIPISRNRVIGFRFSAQISNVPRQILDTRVISACILLPHSLSYSNLIDYIPWTLYYHFTLILET
jgi:hypothetical protein